jgi:hypothetical protein
VGIPELGALWPVLIIVVGLLLLLNARRRRQSGCTGLLALDWSRYAGAIF